MTRFGMLLLLASAASASATDRLTIAVASNFQNTAEMVAAEFHAHTGIRVRLSSGSTGKLYAQIVNGAPYDIFLAADMERPQKLLQDGLGVAGSLRQYVRGMLVLVSTDGGIERDACMASLHSGNWRKLAIANPATAPYGAAAKAWLQSEGLWDAASGKIVMGENIAQTFQFVATGNATFGLISASQLTGNSGSATLSCQSPVNTPDTASLQQGGVILSRSKQLDEAWLFLDFLASDKIRTLLMERGYEVPRT